MFADNGADSIGFRNQTCYTYNGSTTGCTITSPSIIPKEGFDIKYIHAQGIRRGNVLKNIKTFTELIRGINDVKKIIKEENK